MGGKRDPKASTDTSLKQDYFYLSDFVKFGLSVQRRSKLNASSCMGVVLTLKKKSLSFCTFLYSYYYL